MYLSACSYRLTKYSLKSALTAVVSVVCGGWPGIEEYWRPEATPENPPFKMGIETVGA